MHCTGSQKVSQTVQAVGGERPGNHFLILFRGAPHLVLSLQCSLWSLLPAGKSPCISLYRKKRTICILQQILKLRSRNRKWKGILKRPLDLWLRETSRSWCLHRACTNAPCREEEAADLWAPKGETPTPKKSWPRGSLLDGGWDVVSFGKIFLVPRLGSSDLLKSQGTLCQGMCVSLGIPRRRPKSHPSWHSQKSRSSSSPPNMEAQRSLWVSFYFCKPANQARLGQLRNKEKPREN